MQAFERSPANLVRMDNNNFVLTVPASQSNSEAVSEEQLVELEKDPHAKHQVMPLLFGDFPTPQQSDRNRKKRTCSQQLSFAKKPLSQSSAGASQHI